MNAAEQALRVYDSLTRAEQRQIFATTADAVAEYKQTGNLDRLVKFADDVAMTIRLRSTPGYNDAVHAAWLRALDKAEFRAVKEAGRPINGDEVQATVAAQGMQVSDTAVAQALGRWREHGHIAYKRGRFTLTRAGRSSDGQVA